jgi:hypothetical protein
MPIELSQIRERRDTCTIVLGAGASIVFEYLPIKVSELMESSEDGTLEADAAAIAEDGATLADARLLAASRLVDLVAAWDVTQGGDPFPLDAELVATALDLGVLNRCVAGIVEHYATGKTSGEFLNALGTGITSPKDGAKSSPTGTNRASRRNANSSKSRSSRASARGNLRRIPSGTNSSVPA